MHPHPFYMKVPPGVEVQCTFDTDVYLSSVLALSLPQFLNSKLGLQKPLLLAMSTYLDQAYSSADSPRLS